MLNLLNRVSIEMAIYQKETMVGVSNPEIIQDSFNGKHDDNLRLFTFLLPF